jgi:hypothetical protein
MSGPLHAARRLPPVESGSSFGALILNSIDPLRDEAMTIPSQWTLIEEASRLFLLWERLSKKRRTSD